MSTTAEKLQTIIDNKAAIKQAIIDKGGQVGDLTTYADAISNLPSGQPSMWTGHVDVEGLKAIGWDDEDIAYFQEHGINWMEEDDDLYKVSDDNKALYGVLTADNIQEYKDRIVWLPKIDFSGVTSAKGKFSNCNIMIAIPLLDFSHCISMEATFSNCHKLSLLPPLDVSNVKTIYNCFSGCYKLHYLPPLKFSASLDCGYAFQKTYSLHKLILDGSLNRLTYAFYNAYGIEYIGSINTQSVSSFNSAFIGAASLKSIKSVIDMSSASNITDFATNAFSLEEIYIKSLKISISFKSSPILSKRSLLYMIENESATSAITITLQASAYARLANDADIVSALENHPNISLASA